MNIFTGFPEEGIGLLADLENNNNREWFGRNKTRYKELVDEPAKDFVVAMTGKIRPLVGGPGGAKIFRVYRDVRFSKDKTPYNPVIKIAFFKADQQKEKGCSAPMYFFRLHKDTLALGAGVYEFNDSRALQHYRKQVADDVSGPQLEKILKKFRCNDFWINQPHYKKVPAGFEKNHPREELLRHRGLYAFIETPAPSEISTQKAVEFCLKKFKAISPLYNWLNSF
ncbi:hypothetical protein MNBD_NITROSPINAE05-36 [hydrothermal vent metagenome]|uniref:TIGR02453 family protein n=1 Tax=hydrothermal vent metagenome TaxID=652676 RepID=A0A3B1DVX2_9ZZZZ